MEFQCMFVFVYRRIDPAEERIPKLQRIGNFWNFRRFSSRPSAPVQLEKDHFLEVKQKRSSYNGILEDFLMDREKQMQNINSLVNDENDENVSSLKMQGSSYFISFICSF